jgi:hypothetical protein
VSEYVAELVILLWGLEQEIWAEGNFCYRKSGSEGPKPVGVDLGADGFEMWNALHRMTWPSLVLINRNAYIRCRSGELYSNPANWQWGTGVSVGRPCLEVSTSHFGVWGGLFVSTSSDNWRVLRLRKFFIHNKLIQVVAKLTLGTNRVHHYGSSLLRIKGLIVKSVNWWSKINTVTYCLKAGI